MGELPEVTHDILSNNLMYAKIKKHCQLPMSGVPESLDAETLRLSIMLCIREAGLPNGKSGRDRGRGKGNRRSNTGTKITTSKIY